MSVFREKIYRTSIDVGARVVNRIERVIAWGSLVGTPAFFDSSIFPWVGPLEAQWRTVRRELDAVMQYWDALPNFQDISSDQRGLTDDDRWKTFFLYAYGIKAEGNCRRCPETTRLVEAIPGMKTAFFSILAPGKHIPPHRGPYKGVIRYHLGLLVPDPARGCRIRVGSEIRHWEEGRSLLFDDTYEHEAWNDTAGRRAVLFLDVVRPLRFPASTVNNVVLALIKRSPFVQDGARNYRAWEEKLERLTRGGS